MKITLSIPARLVRDIITQAHSRYWLDAYAYRVRTDGNGLYFGPPIKGGEADGDTRIPAPRPYVGALALAAGIAAALQSDNVRHRETVARVLGGDGDGPDADIVLQFAAFGAVHWG